MATSKIPNYLLPRRFRFGASLTENEMILALADNIQTMTERYLTGIPFCVLWDDHGYYVGVGANVGSYIQLLYTDISYVYAADVTVTSPHTIRNKKRVALTSY